MKEIISKWYQELGFSKEYEKEFYELLSRSEISENLSIDEYSADEYNSQQNLLNYLYMCENLKDKYAEKGISTDILYTTLKDIAFYTNVWSEIRNTICLGEYDWLKRHLSMKLFQLGRLQFYMGQSEYDIPSKNISKGDNIIEIHIPEGGSFAKEECLKSIDMAKTFFAEYFPEFEYKHFTCDTWLLDDTISDLLKPGSNILDFQSLFETVERKESYEILRYIFKWNSTKDNIKLAVCKSGFAEKIKECVMAGGVFYEVLGILKNNS